MALAAILFVLAAACSGDGTSEIAGAPTAAPEQLASPAPQSQLQLAFATTDYSVGSNRLAFGIIDSEEGPIRDATVEVQTFILSPGGQQEGPVETVNAVFREWPVSLRGIYTAQLSLDRVGEWGIGIIASRPNGDVRSAASSIQVRAVSLTPQIGSPAPRSATKTLADVDGLDQITTDANPDPDLYRISVADAVDAGKPLMLTFSTPAFCQTATCGPQLDVLKDLMAAYSDRVNFIHVEVYDNPHEIEGDLRNAVVSAALAEWGLPSEPWTFVVDADGVVQAKFEAFTTCDELEAALTEVLPQGSGDLALSGINPCQRESPRTP